MVLKQKAVDETVKAADGCIRIPRHGDLSVPDKANVAVSRRTTKRSHSGKGVSLTQQELKLPHLNLALGTASTVYLGSASEQTIWKLLYINSSH